MSYLLFLSRSDMPRASVAASDRNVTSRIALRSLVLLSAKVMQCTDQTNFRKRQYAEENILQHQKKNVYKQQKISNCIMWNQWLEITSKQTVLFLFSFFCLFDQHENKQLIIFVLSLKKISFYLLNQKATSCPVASFLFAALSRVTLILHRKESGTALKIQKPPYLKIQ